MLDAIPLDMQYNIVQLEKSTCWSMHLIDLRELNVRKAPKHHLLKNVWTYSSVNVLAYALPLSQLKKSQKKLGNYLKNR